MRWLWPGRSREDRERMEARLRDMEFRRAHFARHKLQPVRSGRRLAGIEMIYGGGDDAA